jgi:hypothetical protein
LKDRIIWGGLGIAVTFEASKKTLIATKAYSKSEIAWYLQSSFLYTFLIVAVDESIKSATRITTLTTSECLIPDMLPDISV